MHRVISLPVAGDRLTLAPSGHLLVETSRLQFAVDPQTGNVEPHVRDATGTDPRRDDPLSVLRAHGLELQERETSVGVLSRIVDGAGKELAAFGGRLWSLAIGDHGLFGGSVVYVPGETVDVIAGRLGSTPLLRFPGGAGAADAKGNVVVVTGAEPCVLHIFRDRGGVIARTSIARPEPVGSVGNVLLADGCVWILAGHTLACVVLDAANGADVSLGATFAPFAPSSSAASAYATVAFSLASGMFGVDHPRFGRIVMQRGPNDPQVTKGDQIVLDDVFEELPSIFRVRAWHPRGGRASSRAPAPPMELAAPNVVTRIVDQQGDAHAAATSIASPPQGLAEMLSELGARHRFCVPPTLLRMFRTADEDAVFARWLSLLLGEPTISFPCEHWDADPFLIEFASVGNGDAYCLYPYPPTLGEDQQPPVVEFFHETNSCELRATNFDDFIASLLRDRADGEHDAIVDLVVRRLGLEAPSAKPSPAAPSWLPSAASDSGVLAKADRLIAKGDLIAAERLVVGRWLDEEGSADAGVRRRLDDLYSRLGWSLPRATLGLGR